MPSTCEFELNHPNGVYNSGDTISGAIILNTTSTKEVREICINFHGEGKVSWTETERRRQANGRNTNRTIYFRANDSYADSSTIVCGERALPPGTHRYTFEIVLPLQCPTSCEARYGHIRYELSLKLNRPFRFDNVFSKPLTIIKTQDLNLNPINRLPISNEDTFSTCCFCCSSGSINATLQIPFGGYAIGQNVKYTVSVENQTMEDIKGYTIEFYRKITFTARTPYHKTRQEITTLYTKKYNTPCLRLTNRIYNGNFLIDVTPPSTEGNSIIRIEYFIIVTLHMPCCTMDKTMCADLFLGTVALRESFLPPPSIESDAVIGFTPTAPDLPAENSIDHDLPPNYKELGELGPPSYEAATRCFTPFVDHDKDEHHRHIGFRPLYPSYSQSEE